MFGKGIDKTEFLEDRVRISCELDQPRPGPISETLVIEVRYEDVDNLISAPELPKQSDERYWREEDYIPQCDKTIEIQFHRWRETCEDCMEWLHGGPYLVR